MANLKNSALAVALLIMLSGCEERDAYQSSDQNVNAIVEFSARQMEFKENIGTAELRLKIQPPAQAAGEVVLTPGQSFESAFTRSDFNNNEIRVSVKKGDSLAIVKLLPIDNSFKNGDVEVSFTISRTSPTLSKGNRSEATVFVVDDELPGRPVSENQMRLASDDIYLYTEGSGTAVRLDPTLNDSIHGETHVSFGTASSGEITFVENEGWFYKPDPGFLGTDTFIYTVCSSHVCASETIRMHVEEYLPNCNFELYDEQVITQKDTPIEIRVFMNDTACNYQGMDLFSPDKGTFATYSYSGSFKNIVYVYYPPKGFSGTDHFRYKLRNGMETLEGECTITVN